MSVKTWLKEFYDEPIQAEMTELSALKSCYRKYLGTLPYNLERHDVIQRGRHIIDNFVENPEERAVAYKESFVFNSKNCHLCVYCSSRVWERSQPDCSRCVLEKIMPGCCSSFWYSPWNAFCKDENPQPMIDLIKTSIEAVERNNGGVSEHK